MVIPAAAVLLCLVAAAVSGCGAPKYVIRVTADPSVMWDGWYEVRWEGPLGSGSRTDHIYGSGDREVIIGPTAAPVRGLVVNLTRQTGTGLLKVEVFRGGRLLAANEAGGDLEGVSCAWGEP